MVVTTLSQGCENLGFEIVTTLLQPCNMVVTISNPRFSQPCDKVVTTIWYNLVTTLSQPCHNLVISVWVRPVYILVALRFCMHCSSTASLDILFHHNICIIIYVAIAVRKTCLL